MAPAIAEAIPRPLACPISGPPKNVYHARKPKESPLWQIVEQHLEELLRVYDDPFAPTYGPLRASVRHGLEAFRKCGILDWGFARVRCPECKHEYLLAFSCKRRCLCPSCHKKCPCLHPELWEPAGLAPPHSPADLLGPLYAGRNVPARGGDARPGHSRKALPAQGPAVAPGRRSH